MKKGLIALGVLLLVLVGGYLGTRWYLLGQVQPVLQAQLDRTNEMMTSAGVRFELVNFERGLLSARSTMRMVIEDVESLPIPLGQVEMQSDIIPGPWLSTDTGLATGVAKVRSRFNLDSLDPDLAGAINELFAGQDPITDVTIIGFDDTVRSVTRMAPVKLATNEGSIEFGGFTTTGYMNAQTGRGEAWVDGGALAVKTPQGEGGWPSLSGYVRIDDLVAGQIVGEQNITIDGINLNSILLGPEPVSFDLAMNVDTDVQGDLGSSRIGFWVRNVASDALPADTFYYGLDLENLSIAGYEKMLDEVARIETLQQQMLAIGEAPANEEEMVQLMQLQQQVQALSMQLVDVFVQEILVPEKSHFRLRFMANQGESVVFNTDVKLAFRGLPQNASSAMDLMMMPPQRASRVFDTQVELAALAAALPPPAIAALDVLVEQQLVAQDQAAYRFSLQSADEMPLLNGEAVSFEEMFARIAAARQVLSPAEPAGELQAGEGEVPAPMESLEYPAR